MPDYTLELRGSIWDFITVNLNIGKGTCLFNISKKRISKELTSHWHRVLHFLLNFVKMQSTHILSEGIELNIEFFIVSIMF